MIDAEALRDTLRFWASGVSIVTTFADGSRSGMTVSSFNSISLEPPLVLVCLLKDTITARQVKESGHFAVSILSEDDSYLSDRFAGRIPLAQGEDRFDGVETFTAETGSPILKQAIAWLDCTVYAIHDGGTHWIVVGLVAAAGHTEPNAPLIYFNRGYHHLA